MSLSIPVPDKKASDEVPPRGHVPVPSPPGKTLARAGLVPQSQRSTRREHEVQRVIRDLAALAVGQRPRAS